MRTEGADEDDTILALLIDDKNLTGNHTYIISTPI